MFHAAPGQDFIVLPGKKIERCGIYPVGGQFLIKPGSPFNKLFVPVLNGKG